MDNHKTYVLKLKEDDEERELQFELEYLATLTSRELMDKLIVLRETVIHIPANHGHRGTPTVVKHS